MADDESSGGTTRRAMLMSTTFGAFAAMLASAGTAEAAESSSKEEKAAAKVVSDFVSAWPSRDVDKIASYVSDDVISKGAPDLMETKGKQAFIAAQGEFINGPFGKNITFAQHASHVSAIGGPVGTLVLAKRVDFFDQNGKRTTIPLAAAFWVTDGKIQIWYDFPLVNLAPPGGV